MFPLLSDQLREANSANKDLNRQVQELTSIRMQLEGERDSLAAELADTRDAMKDAQARLDAANNALQQLRSDMEARLREKEDEIENIRYVATTCTVTGCFLLKQIRCTACSVISQDMRHNYRLF